jgi:error-prone DNA polymerase
MYLYVPLWCKSNFSFLEGASHPDEFVDEAYRLGLPTVAFRGTIAPWLLKL